MCASTQADMEEYFTRMKAAADAEIARVESLMSASELQMRTLAKRRTPEAVRQDALAKLEKLRLKAIEKEKKHQLQIAHRQERFKRRLERAQEEYQRRKLDELQAKTRRYKAGCVVYVGDSETVGDAWMPHGWGSYRVNATVGAVGDEVYDGTFCKGMWHGKGRYTFPDCSGVWVGPFRRDRMHGCGYVETHTNVQTEGEGEEGAVMVRKGCVYQDHKKVCDVEELQPGTRVRVRLYHCGQTGGELATIVRPVSGHKPGHYRLRMDNDGDRVVEVDLGDTPFSIARDLPPLCLLDIHMDVRAASRKSRRSLEDWLRDEEKDDAEQRAQSDSARARARAQLMAEREETEKKRVQEAQAAAEEKRKQELQEALSNQRAKSEAEAKAKMELSATYIQEVEEARTQIKLRKPNFG